MRLPAILLALAGALLTGCFSLQQPVISASEAVAIPDLEGDYVSPTGDTVRIEAASSGHDYVGRGKNANGEVEILIRGRPLGPHVLLQTQDTSGTIPGYRMVFVSVVPRGIVVHAPQGKLIELADSFGLTLDASANLSGPEAAILAFLDQVSQLPTVSQLLYVR